MTVNNQPRTLRTKAQHIIEPQPWGRLEWYVSAEIGNSDKMTTGKCVLEPGRANGRHWHPSCDEIPFLAKPLAAHRIQD